MRHPKQAIYTARWRAANPNRNELKQNREYHRIYDVKVCIWRKELRRLLKIDPTYFLI